MSVVECFLCQYGINGIAIPVELLDVGSTIKTELLYFVSNFKRGLIKPPTKTDEVSGATIREAVLTKYYYVRVSASYNDLNKPTCLKIFASCNCSDFVGYCQIDVLYGENGRVAEFKEIAHQITEKSAIDVNSNW
jgi:hypothetical protein